MKERLRAVLMATTVLSALLVGVAVMAPSARADDAVSAAPRYVLQGDPYKRVGAKAAAQLKAAQSINEHATGPKRKVLD